MVQKSLHFQVIEIVFRCYCSVACCESTDALLEPSKASQDFVDHSGPALGAGQMRPRRVLTHWEMAMRRSVLAFAVAAATLVAGPISHTLSQNAATAATKATVTAIMNQTLPWRMPYAAPSL